MNKQFSKTMKSLLKAQTGIGIHILFIILMIIFLGGGIYSFLDSKNEAKQMNEQVTVFDSVGETGQYYKLTPQLLTEPFAAEYDDSVNYCFAFDQDLVYIVAIDANSMDQYEDIIAYTYSEDVQAPEAVTMKGISRELPEDLIDMAIESYNYAMGEELINQENYQWVLGDLYLDSTQEPAVSYDMVMLFLILFAATAIFYYIMLNSSRNKSSRRQRTLERYNEELLGEVDRELGLPNTVHFDKQKLYVTDNYLISSINGFDIIRWDEIRHVYGIVHNNMQKNLKAIVLVTNDGDMHEIATASYKDDDNSYNQIVELIRYRIPDVQIGFEDSFFTMASSGIDEAELGKNNYFLGILGAILGAGIGAVVWILIGKMGFIAGFAGFLMMKFALIGYSKLSGGINRKGQIISIIIAFIMILVASYTQYALEICKYYYDGNYSMSNIISSFRRMPGFLSYSEAWGDFIRDLVIGYLLSIWSGINVIKSVFSRRQRGI